MPESRPPRNLQRFLNQSSRSINSSLMDPEFQRGVQGHMWTVVNEAVSARRKPEMLDLEAEESQRWLQDGSALARYASLLR